MSKTIWIVNDYAGSAYHGMEFRNYYFAKEWVKNGYEVYIITASFMHLFKKLPDMKSTYQFEKIDGINYLWVKVPHYKNSTDKKRVLKWFAFTFKLFFLPLKKMKKPDVIIASPMAPFLVLPAYRLAKKYKAKFIYEVKDIWPLSIVELGGISSSHPLIRAMSFCEKYAITKADEVVSSLQNYGEHLKKDLAIEREFHWINNGVDVKELEQSEPLPKETISKIPKDKFIVGYTGTIGLANGLDSFCKSAELLKEHREIFFVIVGEGNKKEALIKEYGELENLLFIDAIPKQQVQSMLALFDACYIGLKRENLFKYGVSPNKLFDYMYSAKPIVYAIDSGKSNIVKVANCGVSVEAQNENAIANGVKELYDMGEKGVHLGENGKNYILKNFTYDKLALKYQSLMER